MERYHATLERYQSTADPELRKLYERELRLLTGQPQLTAPVAAQQTAQAAGPFGREVPADLFPRHQQAARLPLIVALAAQPGDEQEFESRFASLAYMQLKDRSPKLTDYVVGFQMVDRSEDKKKAVGFFGLKAGDTWMYAPAFYVGGDMKGGELLYVRSWELFVPRNDRWVNHLISRRPSALGKGTDEGPSKFRPNRPDVRKMVRPWEGGGAKTGADQYDWVGHALPFFAALATDPDRIGAKLAGVGGANDLRQFASDPTAARTMLAAAVMSAGIKIGFDRFYGKDFLGTLNATIRTQAVKRAAAVGLADERPKYRVAVTSHETIVQEVGDRAPASFKAKLKESLVDADAPGLDDATRAEALIDGVAVDDRRPDADVAAAYRLDDGASAFQTVNQPGVYDVLTRSASLEECLVINGPFGHGGRRPGVLIVPLGSPGKTILADTGRAYARADRGPGHCHAAVEKLSGVDKPKERGTYAIVGSDGTGTCPFTVESDAGDGLFRVRWHQNPAADAHSIASGPDCPERLRGNYTPWDARIWFTGNPGGVLAHRNDELYVPDGYKVLEIVAPAPETSDYTNGPSAKYENRAVIGLGRPEDLEIRAEADRKMSLEAKTAGQVCLRDGDVRWECSPKAAELYLVLEAGLRKTAAAELVQLTRTQSRPVEFAVVKTARRYGDVGGGRLTEDVPDAPAFPEEQSDETVDNGGSGLSTRMTEGQFDASPVESLRDTVTEPGDYDPYYRPDEQAVQSAQQAADSGLKEVFDASMLTSIARKLSRRPAIDNDIGSMVQAMSRLGMILCLCYYHPENFAEIYGKSELPDLEKSIQASFEALGDTILDLKEKSGEGRAAIDLGGVGMPDTVAKDE